MATSLPWSVKGVDPRTRDAAKAAARRAGMTLGEWLDHKIREEAAEDETDSAQPEQLDIAALSERLARLSQGQMDTSSQAAASAAPRQATPALSRDDIDAVINQAASAERLTRESSARTAGALDSITRWIEKTESRITSGERAAAERQERATNVIADAIKTMGERLVDIERKSVEAQRKPAQAPRLAFSRDGLAAAVGDIRARQRALDVDSEPQRPRQTAIPENRIAALRQDLRELSARIAPASPAPEPAARPRPAPVERAPQIAQIDTRPIEAMLADLGSRLDRLDRRDRLDPVTKPLARIESEVSRLSQERSGESYERFELEIAHLAAKVDALAARGGDRSMLAPVMRDISELRDMMSSSASDPRLDALSRQIASLSSDMTRLMDDRADAGSARFEHDIAQLASKIDMLAARGGDRSVLAPVMRDIAELREMMSSSASDPRLDELSRQISTLSSDLTQLRDVQPDGRELRSLALTIEDVRDAIMADRGQGRHADTAPMMSLSRQIEALAEKIDTIPAMRPAVISAQAEQLTAKLSAMDASGHGASSVLSDRIEALVIKLEDMASRQQPSQLESRIETLQQRIESLAEHGPTAVTRQIEALAGRIENLAASSNLTQLVNEGKNVQVARVDLRPIEDMLRNLAEKIDEAGRPGAGTDSFDALEQQISGIASRLDTAAATRSAETGIERTLQDLVVHLQTLRQDTTDAAERAARAAMADMSGKAAPGAGIAELSSLLTGLRETHVSAGRETQDAIGAVHQTLETIISRLASIEGELATERQAAPAERPAMPPRATEKPRAPVMPAVRMPELPAHVSVALEDRIASDKITPPQPETPSMASLDLPLEPGSGRPRAGAAQATAQDPQSIRQNLIAAARRSAKAATEAATPPAEAAEPAKGGGRLKEIMEKRRRPILLGVAALVLAMGAVHVATGALQGGAKIAPAASDSSSQASEAGVATPKAAIESEPAKPAKDQTSALPPVAPAAALPSIAGQALASVATPEATGSAPMQLPTAAPAVSPDPLQPVTGVGDLPASLGSNGLRKAALAGDARAVYELASKAADSPGATRDPKLALRLFERAAVAGLAPAQFRLGNMFEKGVGAPRDIGLARVWYTRAAERGNAKAMHNLAVLHAEGVSGKPDYAQATEWFRKAAELGVRDSQYNLAILLGRGLGAPADLGQSYLWFSIAAGQGDEDAGRKRDEVGQRMSPADLAAAKLSVERWKPKALEANANEVAPPAKGWDETPSAAARKPAKPQRG